MSEKEIQYNPRRSGKPNFRDFEQMCKTGKSIIYHAPDFVAMDRKTFERLVGYKARIDVIYIDEEDL